MRGFANGLLFLTVGAFGVLFLQDVTTAPLAAFREWQTLATGLLAVIAAHMTVRQMRSSDDLQQRRHELAEQRQDKRRKRMLRGATELHFIVRYHAQALNLLADQVSGRIGAEFGETGPSVNAQIEMLRDLFGRPSWSEARAFFDVGTDRALLDCRQALEDLASVIAIAEKHWLAPKPGALPDSFETVCHQRIVLMALRMSVLHDRLKVIDAEIH